MIRFYKKMVKLSTRTTLRKCGTLCPRELKSSVRMEIHCGRGSPSFLQPQNCCYNPALFKSPFLLHRQLQSIKLQKEHFLHESISINFTQQLCWVLMMRITAGPRCKDSCGCRDNGHPQGTTQFEIAVIMHPRCCSWIVCPCSLKSVPDTIRNY